MKKFLSVLLSFIFFITYFLLTINICFSNIFTKNNIKKVINNINLTEKVKPEDMTPENFELENTFSSLYELAADYDISEEQVDKYINSNETKEFISSYIEKFSDELLNNDNMKITDETLEKELKNSVDEYINQNDFSDHTKQRMQEFMNDNSSKIVKQLPTSKQIKSYIDIPMIKYIQVFLSNTTRIILLISVLLSALLIVLLNLKEKKFLKYLGTTILISNIATLIFGLALKPAFTVILNYDANLILTLLKGFINTIYIDYIIISGVGILISIILLVLYKVLKK